MNFKNAADQFILEKGVLFCNHGSFGAVPKSVLDTKEKFDKELNSNPDLWFRKTCVDLWLQSREAIAPLFSTNPSNLAFVANTTQGANAVLSSIIWQPGDVILVTNITHPAVREACDDAILRHTGVELAVIQVPFPIESEQQLVDMFVSTADGLIEAGKNPRLAVVDAISSMPAIRFPFEKITKALSQKSIEVFVDGAHSLGFAMDLNLDALGADYFAGSIHKWLFGPKGTAVFWCAPKHQAIIRGPIVSFDYKKIMPKHFQDPMGGRFFWQGTVDNSGYACIPKILEFIDNFGGIREIYNYNAQLAKNAVDILLTEVTSAQRFPLPESCVAPYMANIFMPDLEKRTTPGGDLTDELFEEQKAWLPTGTWNDKLFARLSAQIYNTQDDYHKLAVALNKFTSK